MKDELKEKENQLKSQWDTEKQSILHTQELKKEIDAVKGEMAQAERNYDLAKASELKYGKLPELEKQLAEQEAHINQQQDSQLLKEEVGEEDIAQVVSRWTGIPVTKMMTGEREKLLHLDETLHERVVGQDEAVSVVSDASSAPVPASKTRTVLSVPSSSWDRPASAKQNLPRPWPKPLR